MTKAESEIDPILPHEAAALEMIEGDIRELHEIEEIGKVVDRVLRDSVALIQVTNLLIRLKDEGGFDCSNTESDCGQCTSCQLRSWLHYRTETE